MLIQFVIVSILILHRHEHARTHTHTHILKINPLQALSFVQINHEVKEKALYSASLGDLMEKKGSMYVTKKSINFMSDEAGA